VTDVKDLADEPGRSASSVALKTRNLTFLDPAEEEAGVKGMDGVSKQDIRLWQKLSNRKLSNRAIKKSHAAGWDDLLKD